MSNNAQADHEANLGNTSPISTIFRFERGQEAPSNTASAGESSTVTAVMRAGPAYPGTSSEYWNNMMIKRQFVQNGQTFTDEMKEQILTSFARDVNTTIHDARRRWVRKEILTGEESTLLLDYIQYRNEKRLADEMAEKAKAEQAKAEQTKADDNNGDDGKNKSGRRASAKKDSKDKGQSGTWVVSE